MRNFDTPLFEYSLCLSLVFPCQCTGIAERFCRLGQLAGAKKEPKKHTTAGIRVVTHRTTSFSVCGIAEDMNRFRKRERVPN